MESNYQHPSRVGNMMRIKNISTGLVTERQPPDARDAVASGGWVFVDAGTPTVGEALSAMDEAELRSLAASTEGKVRHYNEPKEWIASALTPLVEQGIVTLREPAEAPTEEE